jgi:hypothetical protein
MRSQNHFEDPAQIEAEHIDAAGYDLVSGTQSEFQPDVVEFWKKIHECGGNYRRLLEMHPELKDEAWDILMKYYDDVEVDAQDRADLDRYERSIDGAELVLGGDR